MGEDSIAQTRGKLSRSADHSSLWGQWRRWPCLKLGAAPTIAQAAFPTTDGLEIRRDPQSVLGTLLRKREADAWEGRRIHGWLSEPPKAPRVYVA